MDNLYAAPVAEFVEVETEDVIMASNETGSEFEEGEDE